MKDTLKYLFATAMAAAGLPTYAASGVIELEIPGMNKETAARIVDFRTNACPATVAALRDSIASNYDGVVLPTRQMSRPARRTFTVTTVSMAVAHSL